MSLTPHRDAAVQSVELSRRRYAERGTTDPIRALGETMAIETCRVILVGAADMLDRDVPVGVVTQYVDGCLASALASVSLTLADGHEPTARGLATLCMGDIGRRVQELIGASGTVGCIGKATSSKCEGRA